MKNGSEKIDTRSTFERAELTSSNENMQSVIALASKATNQCNLVSLEPIMDKNNIREMTKKDKRSVDGRSKAPLRQAKPKLFKSGTGLQGMAFDSRYQLGAYNEESQNARNHVFTANRGDLDSKELLEQA